MSIQILPGTHVDVVAGDRAAQLSVTGVVAMPLELDWGDKVTVINQGGSTFASLGRDITDVALKCVNEVLNGAEKLILYRLNNSGVKATGTLAAGITAAAKYPGIRGNDISVIVAASGENWTIRTLVGTKEVDSQTVSAVADFQANDFITVTGTGTLEAATVVLTGGTNGTVAADVWDDFKTELEKQEWNVLAYTGTDQTVTNDLITWVDSLRQRNMMVQMVESAAAADNPAVYRGTIGGVTASYSLTAAEACATLAGLVAKQGVTGSLTHYNSITGWTDCTPHLTIEQQEAYVQAGQMPIVMLYGAPTVLYDINSLTTFTDERPKDFRKGLVMRTLDKYAMDLQKLLDTKAIGKIRNDMAGRGRIKAMIAQMTTNDYANYGYVEDFTADDVTVLEGTDRDAVTATVAIKVTDTVDKIQITVTAA